MKPEDGIEKISRNVVYYSYNITPRHNPKSYNISFILEKASDRNVFTLSVFRAIDGL